MANTINRICVECRIKRYISDVKASKNITPEIQTYLDEVQNIIEDITEDMTMLHLSSKLDERYVQTFGTKDYAEIKHHFNQSLLCMADTLRQKIRESECPFEAAAKMMIVGNYIDYGVFKNVDEKILNELIIKSDKQILNEKVLKKLKEDLSKAKNLTYITDNCGEIVLDRLFIEQLHKDYPQINVTVMVRGGEVVNDASETDAQEIQMHQITTVISNGTTAAGTQLDRISAEAKKSLMKADVIISKGQANAESLLREGLNVYYCLLCKCDYFAKLMQSEKMQAILYKE